MSSSGEDGDATGAPPEELDPYAAIWRNLKRHLAVGATGTFGLQVASVGVAALTAILLARILGADGFGAFSWAVATLTLLSIPAGMGVDRLLVRDVAAYHAEEAWRDLRGLLVRAHQASLLLSLIVALAAAAGAWLLLEGSVRDTFLVAAAALPFLILLRVRRGAMQGLHRVVTGKLPELLLHPGLLLALIAAAWLLGVHLTAPLAMAFYAAAALIALAAGFWLLRRVLPEQVRNAPPRFRTRAWVASALPLMALSGLRTVHNKTDIAMMGALGGVSGAGVYTAAVRGADLVAFVLIAVNAALAPTISRLYTKGDHHRLQSLTTGAARAIFAFSLPVALAFILLGEWFLSLFGPEFTAGATALAILSVGQLVNATCGPAGNMLVMTGHERDAAWAVGAGALLNVGLNALLIPRYGVEGAAVATATSVSLLNVALALIEYHRTGINCTVFARRPAPPGPKEGVSA